MNKEVKQEIINYMDNPLKYAILLSGDWGSGKTYFVEKELSDLKKYYISLNGLSTLSSLSFQIAYQLLGDKLIQHKKSILVKKNIIGNVGNIIVSNLEKKLDLSFSEVIKLLGNVNFKNKLLIFDDLERCSIDIKEILGFINNLVEHNNFKVLIIANEKEIEPIDEYNRIKEKLIYQTIKYVPDLNFLCSNLFKSSSKEVRKNKDFLIDEFKRENHFNVRTIQFIIQRYKEIKIIIKQCLNGLQSTPEINDIIYNDVFKYMVVIARDYKMGKELMPFKENCQLSYYSLIKDSSYVISSFKFVDDFIQGFGIDKDNLKEVLKNYITELRSSINKENNTLGIISRWWECEDQEIEEYTDKILNELKNNIYVFELYPKIITYLIQITNIGFNSIYLKNGLNYMKKNINSSSSLVSLGYRIIDANNFDIQKYNDIKKELLEVIDMHNNNLNKSQINSVKNKKIGELGKYIYNWMIDNKNNFLNKKAFIQEIGIENFLYVINNGNVLDVRYMGYILNDIYNYSNVKELYPNDLELLEQLKKQISSVDQKQFNKMKANALNELNNSLNKIIIQLN